jgi:hypothetical protein
MQHHHMSSSLFKDLQEIVVVHFDVEEEEEDWSAGIGWSLQIPFKGNIFIVKNIIVPEKISSFGCKGSKITDHHHDE